MLIDAHSHNVSPLATAIDLLLTKFKFKKNHVQGAESGGAKAAAVLKEETTQYLSSRLSAKKYRTDIYVYANLKMISFPTAERHTAKKLLFTKADSTAALAKFAAGFSCNDVTVNYVNVADEQVVERKICGTYPNLSNSHI